MKYRYRISMLIFCIGIFRMEAIAQYTVTGRVVDSYSKKPLASAVISILNDSSKVTAKGKTNSNGAFTISLKDLRGYTAVVELSGYNSYTSSRFSFGEFSTSYDLGAIDLVSMIVPVPPEQFVANQLHYQHMLATDGAKELFYALNPGLRNLDLVPYDYPIVRPALPNFKTTKKRFNKKFKKDKKHGEPYISFLQMDGDGGSEYFSGNTNANKERGLRFVTANAAPGEAIGTKAGTSWFDKSAISTNSFYYGRPKKFVFAFWKYGPNGEKITAGPEVEGKFLVKYFTERTRQTPNQCSDATYGYAPVLYDALYKIEVYEEDSKKRLSVSDDEIRPFDYFSKNALLPAGWIIILIRILD